MEILSRNRPSLPEQSAIFSSGEIIHTLCQQATLSPTASLAAIAVPIRLSSSNHRSIAPVFPIFPIVADCPAEATAKRAFGWDMLRNDVDCFATHGPKPSAGSSTGDPSRPPSAMGYLSFIAGPCPGPFALTIAAQYVRSQHSFSDLDSSRRSRYPTQVLGGKEPRKDLWHCSGAKGVPIDRDADYP